MQVLDEKGLRDLRPTWKCRAWTWLYGWTEILEGAATVVSLSLWRPCWTMRINSYILRNNRMMWV